MNKDSKIYIAGHTGMVGSALLSTMKEKGYANFILKTSKELDLRNQQEVNSFFDSERPDVVVLAASKVGGIYANNTYPVEFLYDNLMIQNNVLYAAHQCEVKKLLFLGSSCIYPKNATQPISETALLTGELEKTNEPYALAKIAGIKLCESYYRQYNSNFISVMPTNLFGQNDNFNLMTSHVVPAITRKIHLAKLLENELFEEIASDLNSEKEEVEQQLNSYGISKLENGNIQLMLWGTGTARREFMDVSDFAKRTLSVLEKVSAQYMYGELKLTHINIGTGEDISIAELAQMLKDIIGFKGEISWSGNLEGTINKRLDISILERVDGKMSSDLKKQLTRNYESYKNHNETRK